VTNPTTKPSNHRSNPSPCCSACLLSVYPSPWGRPARRDGVSCPVPTSPKTTPAFGASPLNEVKSFFRYQLNRPTPKSSPRPPPVCRFTVPIAKHHASTHHAFTTTPQPRQVRSNTPTVTVEGVCRDLPSRVVAQLLGTPPSVDTPHAQNLDRGPPLLHLNKRIPVPVGQLATPLFVLRLDLRRIFDEQSNIPLLGKTYTGSVAGYGTER
jgi:hypothetical protein